MATRRRKKPGRWLSDPATVQAIFPGVPWLVVTDGGPAQGGGSKWANPLMVGQPERVEYFAPPAK